MGRPVVTASESIGSCVRECVDLALSLGSQTAESRERALRSANPEFAKQHPRLLSMCSSVATKDDASRVLELVDLMLDQMRAIDAGTSTFEGASISVGQSLGERFIPASVLAQSSTEAATRATEAGRDTAN